MIRSTTKTGSLPIHLLLITLLALTTLVFHAGPVRAADDNAKADRPNIVFIITDDQGYGDLSCHGNPVLKTPNLDALHADSVRLLDYHVSPTCSPTRAALLTGHWTDRTGVWHTIAGRSMLRTDETTIGTMLSDGGYATGMFGKWHLGDNYPFRPEDRGFQEVLRHGGGGVGQTPDYWDNAYFDGSYFHNSKPVPAKGFCTDVFFDYAKKFISAQAEAGKPFFAYISTNAPHGPMHSPPEFARPYEKDHPVSLAHFYGMIANIDHNVGELRKFLDEKGLTENTLFIFTTDNGSSSGWKIHNSGMRAGKGSEYDGGHRVPMFLHWPKGGYTGGRDIAPITAHVDIAPTLLDICGVKKPDEIKFDGVNLRPLLDAKPGGDIAWPERMLVTDSQRVKDPIKWRKSAVMSNDWRLVSNEGKNGKPRHELYQIKEDPGQENNVIDQYPDEAAKLKQFYEDWWADLEPSFKKNAYIALGNPAHNPTCLTSHDWITVAMTPWNHSHIRKGEFKPQNTGFWNVEVEKAGEYEIELRRWPMEADTAIDAGLPPGDDVPGVTPFRATPGLAFSPNKATIKLSGQTMMEKVSPGDKGITFRIKLEAGRTQFSAAFSDGEGRTMGAFYAYVKKLIKILLKDLQRLGRRIVHGFQPFT